MEGKAQVNRGDMFIKLVVYLVFNTNCKAVHAKHINKSGHGIIFLVFYIGHHNPENKEECYVLKNTSPA